MLSIISYLNDKWQGQIPNLILFAMGLILGIILFLILFFLFYLISKLISNSKRKKLVLNDKYIEISYKKYLTFNELYKKEDIATKLKGFLNLLKEEANEISLTYHPNSKDPLFELTLEQLADFLNYFSFKMDQFVNDLLNGKFKLVDYYFKGKTKDIKLKEVISYMNKNKGNTEELANNLFNKIKNNILIKIKKVGVKVASNLANEPLGDLLISFGEDFNNLYSNSNFLFIKKSKKEIKKARKKAKKYKEVNYE